MAKNNAQNAILRQNDEATYAHTKDGTFTLGSVSAPAFNPTDGNMWWGSGNPNTGFLIDTNGVVQTGLSVIHRQGPDYQPQLPTGPGASGTYEVAAGTQPGNPGRAEWNVNYVDNVSAGADPATVADLTAYDSKMMITESRPGFIHSEVFDLDPATHVWKSETSNLAFGGDDFSPPKIPPASADVMSHVASNSFNVAFFAGSDFGTLADETSAGTHWDFREAVFQGGTPHEIAASTTHIIVGSLT